MPISFRITHSALDKDEICIELRCILAEHDYDRFVLVSHSYGSIISSFIITDQILRPKVASALLVDPVTFLLHTPDVAYNFTVRQPRRANEWQLWYFASKDPGIAHALGRRFFWSQNVMWKKDVEGFVNDGRRLTVSLGGKDLIVNTRTLLCLKSPRMRPPQAGESARRKLRKDGRNLQLAFPKLDAWHFTAFGITFATSGPFDACTVHSPETEMQLVAALCDIVVMQTLLETLEALSLLPSHHGKIREPISANLTSTPDNSIMTDVVAIKV
jgi:hypothetical protein